MRIHFQTPMNVYLQESDNILMSVQEKKSTILKKKCLSDSCMYIMLGLLAKVYSNVENHKQNKKWFATNYTMMFHICFMISHFYNEK